MKGKENGDREGEYERENAGRRESHDIGKEF